MTPSKALVGLKKILEEAETKELFERARTGFARDVVLEEGVRNKFRAVERVGWVKRRDGLGGGKVEVGDEAEAEAEGAVLTDEEMKSLVGKVRERKGVVGAEWQPVAQSIKVWCSYTRMSTWSTDESDRSKYNPQLAYFLGSP